MNESQLLEVSSWAASGPVLKKICTPATIVICPEAAASPALQQHLTDSRFLTLEALLDRACLEAGHGPLLGKTAINALVARFIRDNPGGYFNISRYRAGYARAITSTLTGYRNQAALQPDPASDPEEEHSPQFRDFLRLHRDYAAHLQANGLYDKRRAILEGADWLPYNSWRLVFWGFSHLTPSEEYFILCCLEQAGSACLVYSTLPPLFETGAQQDHALVNLRQQAYLKKIPGAARPQQPAPAALTPQSAKKRQSAAALPTTAALHLVEAENRREECLTALHWLCRRLKAGALPREFHLYLANYPLYASYLQELVPAYLHPLGVQADWTGGVPYRLFPLTIFIKNLLQHPHSAQPYALQREIFSSAYYRYTAVISAEDITAYAGSALSGRLGELKHRQYVHPLDYKRILQRQEELYRRGLTTDGIDPDTCFLQYTAGPEGENLDASQLLTGILDSLCLRQAKKTLYAFSARMTPTDFTDALTELLEHCNVPGNLAPPEHPAGEWERRLLDSLPSLYTRFHALWHNPAGSGMPRLASDQLLKRMQEFLDNETFPGPPATARSLAISPLEQTPWEPVPLVMILGLVEGDFPAQAEHNFLDRSPRDAELFCSGDFTSRDRERFAQLLAQGSRELFCALPLTHNGKGLQNSSFFAYLKKNRAAIGEAPPEPARTPHTLKEQLLDTGLHADAGKKLTYLSRWHKKNPTYAARLNELLRCQGLRSLTTQFTLYDGLLSGSLALKANRDILHSLPDFSPAELDLYAGCPLRFFLDRILAVRPAWQEDYHPDYTDHGRFILAVLADYTQLQIKQLPADQLREQLACKIEQKAAKLFKGQQNIFDYHLTQQFMAGLLKEEKKPGLFSAYLAWEAEQPDLLTLAEMQTGGTLEINGRSIAITIPRQDTAPEIEGSLIYNYTTAEIPSPKRIAAGLSFLLPLQLHWLSAPPSGKPVLGAGYIQVRSPGKLKKGGYLACQEIRCSRRDGVWARTPLFCGQHGYGFMPTANLEMLIRTIIPRVERLLWAMEGGIYHLPLCGEDNQICLNCGFKRICRRDQPRLRALRQMAVAAHLESRAPEDYYLPAGDTI